MKSALSVAIILAGTATLTESQLSILSGPPYRAIDGDTFEVRLTGERIRILNIDTPESTSRCKCEYECALGKWAKLELEKQLAKASQITISRTGLDRYNRTLAAVNVDGQDLGDYLIESGLAKKWRGRKVEWCK